MIGHLPFVLSAAWAAGGAPHPNSFSWSEIHIRGDSIVVELRVQVLSLGEVIEGFDDDLDGHTTPDELAEATPRILDYVMAHYRVVPGAVDGAGAADAEAALGLARGEVFEGPLVPDPLNVVADWVDVRLELEPAGAFDRFGVYLDLFQITSPGHRDACSVVWNGEVLDDIWNFGVGAETHVFAATEAMLERNAPVFGRFVRTGVASLAGRAPLSLLVLGLLLVAGARRSFPSGVLVASVLFGTAALGMVFAPELSIGSVERTVRISVPLAIAYLALDDLVNREGRARLLEAAVFGLLAGVLVSIGLAERVALEASARAPLAGFALGALVPAAVAAVLTAIALARLGGEREALAPRALRVATALSALGYAAWLFRA